MRHFMKFAGSALILMVMSPVSVCAEEANQTNWSAGAGVTGPVSEWSDQFDHADQIAWRSVSDQLSLATEPREEFEQQLITNAVGNASSLHPCDIDSDGDIDVLATGYLSDEIAYWRNDGGSPINWFKVSIESGLAEPISVYGRDMDNDGDVDVVASLIDGSKILLWRHEPGIEDPWVRIEVSSTYPGHQVYADDIDDDGLPDIISCSQNSHDVWWWRNGGGDLTNWESQCVGDSFDTASSVFVADLDGDGKKDIMSAACYIPGEIAWWRNSGGDPINWQKQTVDPSCSLAHWVQASDFDNDGDIDLLGAAYWGNNISWYRNDGGDPINWSKIDISAFFFGPLVAHPADMDGDGDFDVLGTSTRGHRAAWFENVDGTGETWLKHWVGSSIPNAWPIAVADLDGQGDLEVIVASSSEASVYSFDVMKFKAAGDLISSILDIQSTGNSETSIDWDASAPSGTEFSIRLRTSNDPGNMGAWSDQITSPGPLDLDLEHYVQYKVSFATSDSLASPVLTDLCLSWIAGVSSIEDEYYLRHPFKMKVASPARDGVTITFDLPLPGPVEMNLFDAGGRLVRSLLSSDLPEGRHEITLGALAAGVYLCRLTADDREDIDRVVVLH